MLTRTRILAIITIPITILMRTATVTRMDIGVADTIGEDTGTAMTTTVGHVVDGVSGVNTHTVEADTGTDAGADNGINPLK